MNPWVRGIVIVLCLVALAYLVVQFGTGLSDDPALQATPEQSIPE
jgi:hypothetical protein